MFAWNWGAGPNYFFGPKVPPRNHREEGKHLRELFEKICVNAVFFLYFGIWGGFLGPTRGGDMTNSDP